MNSPKEIAQGYIATGAAKAKLPAGKTLVLGIMAGMFIAVAAVGAIVSSSTVASQSLARLIGAAVFPVGLAMTVVAGGELFTGNCLIIVPVLEKEVKLTAMLRNWCLAYIGNFAGSILIAAITVYGGTFSLFGDAAAANLLNTAVSKVNLGFFDALLRGVLCNFLVCMAVWMSYAAKDIAGKIIGLYLPTMLFVLCSYEHSIANMLYIPAGLFAARKVEYLVAYTDQSRISSLTWGAFVYKNLIPVTIGNIIGGAALVGLTYWLAYLRKADDQPPAAHVNKNKKKKR